MSHSIDVPQRLTEKYDDAAQRCCSYPAARYFRNDFTAYDYQQLSATSNQALLPRDLSIYLHAPACHSFRVSCAGNNPVTSPENSKVNNYFSCLLKEIELRAKLFDDDRRVRQIHFGCGTAHFFDNEQLAEILDCIASHFHLDLPSRLEVSIEVDPEYSNEKHILNLSHLGLSRFSIAALIMNSDAEHSVNWLQSNQSALETICAAQSVGHFVNVDIIADLSKQTPRYFGEALQSIIDSGVSRIAVHRFPCLAERFKAQKQIDNRFLPDKTARLQLSHTTRKKLLESGYRHIGMDQYALPNDDLATALNKNTLQRNFHGYSTHSETDLIGIGLGAISHFQNGYAQNISQQPRYQQRIQEGELPISRGIKLNKDDILRAAMIQQIMCRNHIDLEQSTSRYIETTIHQTLAEYFSDQLPKLRPFVDDGLIGATDNSLSITPLGRYFMRQIAAAFDNYSVSQPTNEKIIKFSRVW